MFFSEVPLSTQLVIGGVLMAFEFGASVLLFDFAKRTIGKRFARRAASAADQDHTAASA